MPLTALAHIKQRRLQRAEREARSQLALLQKAEKAKAEAEAKAKADAQKSITCVKGKLKKKFSGTNPKCPKGYKKK